MQRFGRNRRRRARESLAAAEAEIQRWQSAHEMVQGLLSDCERRRVRAEQEIADAKEIVGQFSILFPPERMLTNAPRRAVESGAPWVLGIDDAPSCMVDPGDAMPDAMTVRRIPLPVLLTRFDVNQMRGSVHVLVEFNDREAQSTGYAINQRAILATPEHLMRDRIVRAIAPEIARHFAAQFYQPRKAA